MVHKSSHFGAVCFHVLSGFRLPFHLAVMVKATAHQQECPNFTQHEGRHYVPAQSSPCLHTATADSAERGRPQRPAGPEGEVYHPFTSKPAMSSHSGAVLSKSAPAQMAFNRPGRKDPSLLPRLRTAFISTSFNDRQGHLRWANKVQVHPPSSEGFRHPPPLSQEAKADESDGPLVSPLVFDPTTRDSTSPVSPLGPDPDEQLSSRWPFFPPDRLPVSYAAGSPPCSPGVRTFDSHAQASIQPALDPYDIGESGEASSSHADTDEDRFFLHGLRIAQRRSRRNAIAGIPAVLLPGIPPGPRTDSGVVLTDQRGRELFFDFGDAVEHMGFRQRWVEHNLENALQHCKHHCRVGSVAEHQPATEQTPEPQRACFCKAKERLSRSWPAQWSPRSASSKWV